MLLVASINASLSLHCGLAGPRLGSGQSLGVPKIQLEENC